MNPNIEFNVPLVLGNEFEYLNSLKNSKKFCGDGYFTKKSSKALEQITGAKKVLLTTSCTHALELAALILDIKENDEIIMPSYTFVSTANAFVLRGAKIVFVDIHPETMNIDESKIEQAITTKTKIIVPVHYGGVACNMDEIMSIAKKYNLFVIEDAAQAMCSYYKGKHLGTIGHLGGISFHETKNIHCGEGGALLINQDEFIEKAEIIREKGTNRSKFLRGEVDKYTWKDIGSSFLPSELNAAFLLAQLEKCEEIRDKRKNIWDNYYNVLSNSNYKNFIELPILNLVKNNNGHLFFIKLHDINARQVVIDSLKKSGIQSVFHYIPLHSSFAGKKFGSFSGRDEFTSNESNKLLRLPMHLGISLENIEYINNKLSSIFI